MASKKDIKKLIKAAESAGWSVELTRGDHWRFRPPTGRFIIASQTPSDSRAWLNTRAALRRAGLAI